MIILIYMLIEMMVPLSFAQDFNKLIYIVGEEAQLRKCTEHQ